MEAHAETDMWQDFAGVLFIDPILDGSQTRFLEICWSDGHRVCKACLITISPEDVDGGDEHLRGRTCLLIS